MPKGRSHDQKTTKRQNTGSGHDAWIIGTVWQSTIRGAVVYDIRIPDGFQPCFTRTNVPVAVVSGRGPMPWPIFTGKP